jgi:LysM repeat protein
MQRVRNSILFFLLLAVLNSDAQNPETIRKYIETYKDIAVQEMQRTGVPASITLAQGIHETSAGTSDLVLKSNNHFGIKCKANWTGESVSHDDDARGECFRKYPSPDISYRDHSDFLKNSQRYASLFTLDPTDYAGWANGLKAAGYATNPKYPVVLIKLIEDYQLQDYTMLALGKQPAGEIITAVMPVEEKKKPEPDVTAVVVDNIVQLPVYPEGEFRIYETKVVFVRKGTSYLAIAKQYDTDLSKIFEFNEIPKTEEADKDQLVYLQRKRKTGKDDFYFVQPGETLHDIAQKQAIRIESLIELNWLKEDDKPAAGEKLSLKQKSATIPKLVIKDNYAITPDIKTRMTN